MTFHVGQKVVCVDDRPFQCDYPTDLKAGHIYTIADVWNAWDGLGVALIEIKVPHHPSYPCVNGWRASRFRPIVERQTDISIFTEMLNRIPNELEAAE